MDTAATRLNNPIYSQPICTALQIALVDLLSSWNITPTTIVGHSSGEIAAAYCVGALSRESAWKLSYFRGIPAASLRDSSQDAGSMMAVGLSEAEIKPYLDQTESMDGDMSVGCINSPRSITLSGCEKRIDAIQEILKREGVFTRKLKVDTAYHSVRMRKIASIYESSIQDIQKECLPAVASSMFSSVTGNLVSCEELSESKYWVDNLISPVKFFQAITSSLSRSPQTGEKLGEDNDRSNSPDYLLEIGPHAALQSPLREILVELGIEKVTGYSSVLIRSKSASDTALEMAGRLFCKGYRVNIAAVNGYMASSPAPGMLIDLPAYPFNHGKKYWLESRISKSFRFRRFPRHALLGTPVSDWNPLEARWRNIIRSSEMPWIKDHKVLQCYRISFGMHSVHVDWRDTLILS